MLALRVDSFWGRKVSLNDLLREASAGAYASREKRAIECADYRAHAGTRKKVDIGETVFGMRVRHVRIENGWVLYNDVREADRPSKAAICICRRSRRHAERPMYPGTFDWKSFQFTSNRFLPIPMSVSSKFTAAARGFHDRAGRCRSEAVAPRRAGAR